MDVYVERKRTGFFANLFNSIVGVLIGILFFLGSFPLLWWNEGRTDLSQLARNSIVASPNQADPALEGKFVSVSAPLVAASPLEDPLYLNPGPYASLSRQVEVYAWVEKTETTEEKNLGGSTDTTTVYKYVKEWTATPERSSSFKIPQGHENILPPVASQTLKASALSIGAYQLDTALVDLPSGSNLPLTPDLLKPGLRLENGAIYAGLGTSAAPFIGDMRITYQALRSGENATAFGQATGNSLSTYANADGDTLLRVLLGSREEAIAKLASEHKLITWVLRVVGFLLMWGGLGLFFGPINTTLDIVPFLGKAGRAVVGLATFPVALILSLATILLSMIFHNLILLIITVVLLIGAFIFFGRRKQPRAA
jgi:hypothetical protein